MCHTFPVPDFFLAPVAGARLNMFNSVPVTSAKAEQASVSGQCVMAFILSDKSLPDKTSVNTSRFKIFEINLLLIGTQFMNDKK